MLILEELPESLDETYERILREIRKPNQGHAHRLMQCLVAAARPLRVKELAEVLAFDFNVDGIPKLNVGRRWEDQEETVMSACSSLVMIVKDGDSRVVQFSHFSVKEYLTANRLAEPTRDVSRYHIRLEAAHTIFAQACLGALLRLDDSIDRDKIKDFPLALYAAQYWATHARVENVSSRVKNGIECLFDADKPQFATWLWIYNEDGGGRTMSTMCPEQPEAVPLYYAAMLGFPDLAEHLLVRHPEHIYARGGGQVTPMHIAASEGHADILSLLLDHGADVDGRGNEHSTPLHQASAKGNLKAARCLLDYGADTTAKDIDGWTGLHWAVRRANIQVVRYLQERGADVNTRTKRRSTPLRVAACGSIEISRILLVYGANVSAEDNEGRTPLHVATQYSTEAVRALLEHGANVHAGTNRRSTPLHQAVPGSVEILRALLEHGTNVGAKDEKGRTPLQVVAGDWTIEVICALLELGGADLSAGTNRSLTPLHKAVREHAKILRMLLDYGANVRAEDDMGRTPLHLVPDFGSIEIVHVLLKHGANVGAEDNEGRTPLHVAAHHNIEVVRMLLKHGADVNARTNRNSTPLHVAARENIEISRVLLEHGASARAEDCLGTTPLHVAARENIEISHMLLEHGASAGAKDCLGITPLHVAAQHGNIEVVRMLFERGADIHARSNSYICT